MNGLKKGVYFRNCGEMIYARDVDMQREYLFNEIAGVIFTYYSKNSYHDDLSELFHLLRETYDVEDDGEFEQDIKEFLLELRQENLIVSEKNEEDETTGQDIGNTVSDYYRENNKLSFLALELTYRCNERCIHCYLDDNHMNDDPNEELTLHDYQSILDEAYSLGCINVLLTGGEVSLRSDFIEIAKYAADKGMLVDIYTNGIALTDRQIDEILALKPNSVSVSLYGGDAKTHDSITRVPGSFDKTLKTAMTFRCAGVDTFIKSVAIKQNVDSLKALHDLGKRLRIDIQISMMIGPTVNGRSAKDFFVGSEEQYQQIMALGGLKWHCESAPDIPDGQDIICTGFLTELSIDPYGNYYPCLTYRNKIGNYHESALSEVWNSERRQQVIRKNTFTAINEKCSECGDKQYCPMCFGFMSSDNREHDLMHETCLIAQATKSMMASQKQ